MNNEKKKYKLMLGDNMESLKKLPDNSVDSVVSDPPYGLSFMGKKWDYDVPSVEFWKEVYRVLKPGGHVLSFGGTRTYHRMVVNIEDAGFEIRDQVMWLYGSGFPKSLNVGKAVDKLEGNEREVVGEKLTGQALTTRRHGDIFNGGQMTIEETKGNSPWEGWGTALKPANEPICVARKPLSEKSVAENVLKWGTGGINIDGCRVGTEGGTMKVDINKDSDTMFEGGRHNSGKVAELNEGRFPANIILECICDEVIKGEKGELKEFHRKDSGFVYGKGLGGFKGNYISGDKGDIHTNPMCPCRLMDDKGGASRFFYQAKVSKKERNMGLDGFEEVDESRNKSFDVEGGRKSKYDLAVRKNSHPTIKPVQLMTYLCRLVTPPNGIVLDPFMGSGSTGIAAQLEGFRFVGMEMEEEYFKIAEARIESWEKYKEFKK